MCQHEMFVYSADPNSPGQPVFNVEHDDRPCCSPPQDATGLQAIIRQPVCGGVYRPTVQAFSVSQDPPPKNIEDVKEMWTEDQSVNVEGYAGSMEVVGPYLCIGSLCDSKFKAQAPGAFGDENRRGEYGKIVREGAEDAEDVCRQCCTDADNFEIKFEKENAQQPLWSEAQWQGKMWNKAKLLSALFLLDYMFFEQDGAFECCPDPNTICRIKCCDLYCCGALVPCYCELPKGGDESSD